MESILSNLSRYSITSTKGEKFWGGAKAGTEYVQGTAKDIEENRRRQEAFFNNNPELTFLSNDDDKHSEGSVWHQKRQGFTKFICNT